MTPVVICLQAFSEVVVLADFSIRYFLRWRSYVHSRNIHDKRSVELDWDDVCAIAALVCLQSEQENLMTESADTLYSIHRNAF